MFVGEQPGDKEDMEGRPFVGRAGTLLRKALVEAGLDRKRTYVTNAVKHFKWEPRGKRRLHRRPNAEEIEACHPWLELEIAALKPRVIVALGATAARALLRRPAAIATVRKQRMTHPSGARLVVTYHPSAVLRADEAAAQVRAWLIEDLRRAARLLQRS